MATSRSYRRNIPLFYAYQSSAFFFLWGGIWIKYLLHERGLELRWILLMDLPFWLVVALLQAPTGAIADRIGRRRVMAISGLAYAITILGFGFTTNYWLLFIDYVIWGVAQAMQTGADEALIYESLRQDHREAEFARVNGRGFACQLVAGLAGVVLGGWLASWTSLAFVIQVGALPSLVSAFIALQMREPPLAVGDRHYWADLRAGVSFAWRVPTVRYTVLLGSVLLVGTFGPVILVQPFLLEHDVATGLYGVYQAPIRLAAVVGAVIAFRLITRAGVGSLLIVSVAGITLAYGGLALSGQLATFMLFAIPAFLQGLSRPAVASYLNSRIPGDLRATVISVMSLCFALQVAFFEPALGFLADDVSMAAAFAFAALYIAVTGPPLLALWRRADRAAVRNGLGDTTTMSVVTPVTIDSPPC